MRRIALNAFGVFVALGCAAIGTLVLGMAILAAISVAGGHSVSPNIFLLAITVPIGAFCYYLAYDITRDLLGW